MLHVAICDDEKKILDDLFEQVRWTFEDADISCYSDGKRLISDNEKSPFDMVFQLQRAFRKWQ